VTENRLPDWPSRSALFLDLDGTLLEFADQPDAVEPSSRLRNVLGRLSRLEHGAVAFVSGRTIEELDRLLAPHRFALAGVHGNERRDSQGRFARSPANIAVLNEVLTVLRRFEASNAGVIVEDKTISVALHYRQRPDLGAAIERVASELTDGLPTDYELLRGSMVVEIKPAGVNKGSAIRAFMSEAPFAGRTPVFIGDDITDEAGFRVVNELGGVSIKVNSGDTVAKWYLRDVDAVLAWLEAMVAE